MLYLQSYEEIKSVTRKCTIEFSFFKNKKYFDVLYFLNMQSADCTKKKVL